jgi:hypothetical protein
MYVSSTCPHLCAPHSHNRVVDIAKLEIENDAKNLWSVGALVHWFDMI